MSRIDDLIAELCPDGVEFSRIGDVASVGTGSSDRKDANDNGKFPFYVRSKEVLRIDTYEFDEEAILIPGEGGIGDIFHYVSGRYALHQRAYRICFRRNEIDTKFAYYFFSANFKGFILTKAVSATVTSIRKPMITDFRIPFPPLEVQREIVKILDAFTELEAELEARQNQYQYYRDSLLQIEYKTGVKMMTLGELATFRRGSFPQPYGDQRWYDGQGAMPFVQVVDVGSNMRLVDTTKNQISILAQPKSVFASKGSVVVTLQGSIGRVAIVQYDCFVDRTLAIFSGFKVDINKKYFAYQLEAKFAIEKESARGSTIKTITKEEFTKFEIPIPLLEEQDRIVAILDKFAVLLNDITTGLPAEIAARRKQYAYYRDKLLTFKEAA